MNEQTPFEKRTREVLDESAGRLDGHTARSSPRRVTRRWRGWRSPSVRWWACTCPPALRPPRPAGRHHLDRTAANTESQLAQGGNGSAFEDIDLLADGDAPDFVSETDDVEFYEWAAGEIES